MKKIIYTAAMMLVSLSMGAQVVTVGSVDKVNTTGSIDKPAISADGSFVVAYMPQSGGIVKITPDGKTTTVAEGQGLYGLAVTEDGNSVVFNRRTYNKQHLGYTSLEVADLNTGAVKTMVKPTRQLNAGVSVSGSTVTAVEKGKTRAKSFGAGKTMSAPVASISYGHLQVTNNGKTETIDPQGRGSYIWPSVSPDGTKVVYWLVGGGCYVCNLDGSDVQRVGGLRAAVWAGNDMIIGMDEREGMNQEVTASSLVVYRLSDGATQTLTDDTVKAQYPAASKDGSKVAFTTPDGQLYMMTLTK